MATITKVVRYKDVAGIRRRCVFQYTGPASYVNPGGDVISAVSIGLGKIEQIDASGIVPDANGANLRVIAFNFASDNTSVTARWFTDLATEVANAVNLSAYTVRIEAVGK